MIMRRALKIFAYPRLDFLVVVLLINLSVGQACAAPYVLSDAGTSFSPHGYGLSAGLRVDNWNVEIGTGSSKNGVAGFPISVDARVLFNPGARFVRWQVGGGLTRYHGSDSRVVVFSEHSTGNYRYQTHSTWDFWYGRLAFGPVIDHLRWWSLPIFIPIECGVAKILRSKVTADLSGIDGSNLGSPIGIDTGNYYDNHFLGEDDFGIYVRVGIGLEI
jgi:hypothetical protein